MLNVNTMKNPALSLIRAPLARFCLLVLLSVGLVQPVFAANAAPSDTQFTSVIDDLPLMPGLNTVPDSDTLFVEPHVGRIAETEASGKVTIDDVYNFYRRSLPHLGWKVIDGHTFQRDGERLLIDAHSNGEVATVRFSVKPAS